MSARTVADGLSWAPQRSVFIRRSIKLGIITFLVLATLCVGLSLSYGAPYLWAFPTTFILTLGFIFDDTLRWRAARYDRWLISGGHLIHEGQDGSAQIPLVDIDRAFRRLGSDVVVQLTSGKRIVLRYLPYPAETAAQINAATPK